MEDLEKLIQILVDLLNWCIGTRGGLVTISASIAAIIFYTWGYNNGNKKKPPEFKVKLKNSYSLEELDNLSLKKESKKE